MPGIHRPYLDAICNHSFQFILILNHRGIIQTINPLLTQTCGTYVRNAVGAPLWEGGWWKVSGQTPHAVQQAVVKAAQGAVVEEETPFLDKNGKSRLGSWIFSPVRDGAGQVVEIILAGLDISERRQKERALAESDTRYKNLVNNIPGTAFRFAMSTNGDFHFNFVGENCITFFGYPARDIIENPGLAFERIPQPDRDKVYQAIQISAETLAPYKLEHRITRKDGKTIWVYTSSVPHRKETGKIIWDGIVLDITDRKTEKALLERSEKKWQDILVNTPQLGISLDTTGRITFANAYFLQLTGWQEEEVLGRDWFDLFIPDPIKETVRQVFLTTMKQKTTEGVSRYENDIKTKTGDLRNIAWSNVLTKDAAGKIKDITCLGIDLTERIRAETALKESEAKYRSMMESMDEAAYICSAEFRVEYMNPAMIKKIGRDATGEICHMAIHNRQEHCTWCQHPKIMKGQTVKTELFMENGEKTYFISHSPIYHTDGSVSKLSIYRDVTEIKRLETRLQQSQKMESIGTLAGGIAHDFNNLLFPIMGQAELLIEDLPQGSPEAESAHEIFKAGKRGRDLVRQILSFSRQSDKKVMPIRIQRVLKEVLKLSRATIPSDIEIIEDIRADCGRILAEPTQLHQVIMNLVTNAFHAVESAGGQIRITLDEIQEGPFTHPEQFPEAARHARLVVADTGVGIPPDLIGKIFDPYFTTKERGKGTGLGLATVYGIVKEYNGEIRVSSTLGQGTAFTLYFPILPQAPDDHRTPTAGKVKGGHERILVVDDEEAIAMLEKNMLERAGYAVTPRTGSIDALEKFRADPKAFDLVITDMAMPNMTGDRLAEKILTVRPDIPIIICTGFSERMDRTKARQAGIKGFLKKPIVAAELMRTIRDLLDDPRNAPA